MSSRCGSIEDMSENDSVHVQYSVFTLQQATFEACVYAVHLQGAWGGSKNGGVGGWVGMVVYVHVWVSGGGGG